MKIFARLAVSPRPVMLKGPRMTIRLNVDGPCRQVEPLQALPVEKQIHHRLIASPGGSRSGQPRGPAGTSISGLHLRARSGRTDGVESSRHELA